MIKKIYIDNYNSLVNFSIDLKKINILIGKNGVGKTSVFRAIEALSAFVSGHRSVDEIFLASTLTKWMRSDIQTFELYLDASGHEYLYHLEIEYSADKRNKRVKKENVKYEKKDIFDAENGKVTLYNDSFAAGPVIVLDWNYSGVGMVADRHDNTLLSAFKREIAKVIVCSPKPYRIRNIVNIERRIPDYDFSQMGEILKWMMLEAPDKIISLNEEYRKIFPSFSRVYLSGGDSEKELNFAYNIEGKECSFRATDISDGERQLYILYMLAMYYFKEGYTLFIDEPDNYISIREIQPWCIKLEQISEDVPTAGQCLLVSHHGEVIDYLANSSGIWMSREGNYITRITDAPHISPDV